MVWVRVRVRVRAKARASSRGRMSLEGPFHCTVIAGSLEGRCRAGPPDAIDA